MGEKTQNKEDRCLFLSHVRNLESQFWLVWCLLVLGTQATSLVLFCHPQFTAFFSWSNMAAQTPAIASLFQQEQEGCTNSIKGTSLYMPLARTQAYGPATRGVRKRSLYSGKPYIWLKVRNLRKKRNKHRGKLAVSVSQGLAKSRICCKLLA